VSPGTGCGDEIIVASTDEPDEHTPSMRLQWAAWNPHIAVMDARLSRYAPAVVHNLVIMTPEHHIRFCAKNGGKGDALAQSRSAASEGLGPD
jgi:hypothetical protein